jgi:hypothetical protein
MRRKPVTRVEIRFNGNHITTLPANTVRETEDGRVEVIEHLWTALVDSLNKAQRPKWRFGRVEPPNVIACPDPDDGRGWHKPRQCPQCKGKFYPAMIGNGNFEKARYCSDRCRNTKQSLARSKDRAAGRARRVCAGCGQRFDARRSTMRFCSGKCRVAGHRAAKRTSTP